MKRIYTLLAFVFFALILIAFSSEFTLKQDNTKSTGGDDPNYQNDKKNFWLQYQNYKNIISDPHKAVIKPIDPTGKFYIDEYGNFSIKSAEDPFTFSNIIPPHPQPDVVSGYTWSQPAATYTTITGGSGTVALTTIGVDDNVYSALPVGFTFTFDGTPYTTFGLCANGWISMGSTVPTSSYTPLSTGTTRNLVSVMSADLLGNATGRIEYQTSGVSPNRVLTIQWSNWAFYAAGLVDGSVLNFQIKLFETSNNIQLIYGTNTQSATAHTVQVGLGGAATTDYNNRTTATNWSATTAGGANSATCTMSTTCVPATNLTFQWVPPVASPMTYVSSTTAQYQNGLNVLQNSTNNAVIQVQVVMSGTLSPINMTSMAFSTTGSTNPPTDITNAKVYYTGTSAVFATTTQFGSTFTSPNGAFTISGSTALAAGTNYFWITYDVPVGGVIGNLLDAQCTIITGDGTMGTKTPTVTAPAGWKQIDNYCRGTVTNSGCTGTGIYINGVVFGTINTFPGACDPNANYPYAYNWYTAQPIPNVEATGSYAISIYTGSTGNQQGFAVWVDWNNNNSFADAGEYYNIGLIPSGGANPIVGSITVPAGTSLGNHRMRVRNNFSTVPLSTDQCTNLNYGETEDYTINVVSQTSMAYTSSTTTQISGNFYAPQTNMGIIGVQVVTTGTLSPLSLTSLTLNTNGSTNPATDLTNAKVWYTGLSSTFATTTQFGSTFNAPNGSFVVPGSQVLQAGTNYFWVTYDLPVTATTGDFVDAECNSLTVGSPFVPTVQAPAGNRQILGTSLCGTFTIPGSYPSIAAAIADLNLKGIGCSVVFNVAAGYTETAANLVLSATGTPGNTITFQKSGAGANPKINAGVGISTTSDAFIKINGGDYITFDGIDLAENAANLTTTTTMEWGYALNKPNGTNGCQNDVIKNCAITLNKAINTATMGIYCSNVTTANVSQTVTNISGANSNNLFQNNTITNTNSGIYFNGYADVSPYTFYDQNNSATGNNITNFGTTLTGYGLYNIYQNGLNISSNIFNSTGGTNSTTTLYGIFCSTMNNSNLTIDGNTVTVVSGSTTSSVYAINVASFSAGTTNNISITNNTITSCGYPAATTGTLYHLYISTTNNNLTVTGNRVIGNNYGQATSTGSVYYLYNGSSSLNSINISNNLDSANTITGAAGSTVYYMYNSSSVPTFTFTGNSVKNNTNGFTTSASTCYNMYIPGSGTTSSTFTGNTIQNNTYSSTAALTIYGLYNGTSSPTINFNNNTVSANASNGTGTMYLLYNGGAASTTFNMNNNIVTNNQKLTATGTGSIYCMYQTASHTGAYSFSNNTVSGNSAFAAGSIYSMYQIGSPTAVVNVTNNTISSQSSGGAGTIYGLYTTCGATATLTESGNNVFNITSAGGTIYGTYNSGGTNYSYFNNTIHDISNTLTSSATSVYGSYDGSSSATSFNYYSNNVYNILSAGTGSCYGIYNLNTTPVKNMYSNTVYGITSGTVSSGGQAGGMYIGYATTGNLYKNRIYNITSYNSTGSSPACFGLLVGSSGTTYNIYNNIISELKAPVATVAAPNLSIIGIFHNIGTANVYYNTVYLDATSTGATFGCAALWSNTAYTLDLRNNILINKSTPTGTGIVCAYQRNGTSIATYALTSDRNNFYAGTPGVNRVIFYDGTNNDQTLTAYKSRVGPTRDANSVTENSPFVNTSSSPYNLHLQSCIASQCESNGSIISSPVNITTDFDGNPRYPNAGYPACFSWAPTAPDIGADEWDGQFLDAVPPVISYTPLSNGVVQSSRPFTNVSIVDPSGVNSNPGTMPRVYYKKSTDANTFVDNSFCTNGWKYAESNGGSSPYDFTIDYNKLYDPSCFFGGAVNGGDIIQYFVVAQDNAATPNIAINSGSFAGSPVSVGDYANIFPLGGTINQYIISANLFSGNYYIGTGQPYLSLSGSTQGFFQALNAGVVTGNVTAYITSDLTEDGTNQLGSLSYDVPGANYTVTIKPFDATEKLISGSSAVPLIAFTGGDNVTIDGNGGFDVLSGSKLNISSRDLSGTKYLRFRNTSGTAPVFSFINDSRRNTIKNCTIESNNSAALGSSATIVIGGTTGSLGNDSLFFIDDDIRDRSDAAGTPICALLASGNVAAPNDYLLIQGCNIYNTFNAAATFVDLYLLDGNANMTIQNNSFYQTATRSPSNLTAYFAMIMATSGSNNLLTGNYLGGTAPLCGGSPMTFTDCSGMLGFRLFQTGIASPTVASNNTIANMDIGYTGTAANFLFRAFDINGSISAYVNCTNNTIGSLSSLDNIVIRFNPATSAAAPNPCAIAFGFSSGTVGYPIGSVTNNTIGGITLTGTGTQTATTMSLTGIGIGSQVTTAVNVTGNTIGGTVANSIRNTMSVTTNSLTVNGISSAAATNLSGANISNNTVQNINNTSTNSTASILRGIYHNGTGGFTANSNIIHDLNCASTQSGGASTPEVVGIMTSSGALNQSINQNLIYNINATTTGAFSPYASGITLTSSTATANETRNRIYGITNAATGSPIIYGICNYWGVTTSNCVNNEITLTNGEPTDEELGRKLNMSDHKALIDVSSVTVKNSPPPVQQQHFKMEVPNKVSLINTQVVNTPVVNNNGNNPKNKIKNNPAVTYGELSLAPPVQENIIKPPPTESDLMLNNTTIYGIYDDATTAAWNYYYNSVYIGGQATTGTLTSFCLRKTSYANNIINNVFFNARTNGGTATGSHYAITSTGIPSAATNYNVYVSFNPATLAQYSSTDQTIAQWRTSTGRDKQTWSTTSSVINPSNLFTSIAAGNLDIQSGNTEAWLVSGKGIAITGQNIDYSGNTRVTTVNAGCTDIGANEFSATPPGNPAATQDLAPGSGVTSTYTLWGRNIAQIVWNTGGTSYPTGMTVNYYSGQNPGNTLGGNFSNSHTTITATGTLTGAYADLTYYFGDNETFTITTPSSNTILSKYDPSSWEVFALGGGQYQTQLTFNAATQVFTAKVTGLYNFSDFALTDATSPLPVDLNSFNAVVTNRDIKINWVTGREINNKGFDIERRIQTDAKANTYSEWLAVANISGHGTTNEQHTYSYTDKRLLTGKYQYRLKQTDFNNNIEYFSLHNPDIVEIGKPVNSDISQNYPNPSNPKSKIDYQIPFNGKVSIKVYDIIGREVTTIVDAVKEAGYYTAEFDGTNLASGVYFYRILAEGEGQKYINTKKMILVK